MSKPALTVTTLAALSLAAVVAVPAAAKTLVYCSEGTPDSFDPMLTTSGISFDVTHSIFNRLVEFKTGTTEIVPGLAGNGRRRRTARSSLSTCAAMRSSSRTKTSPRRGPPTPTT